MIKPTFWRRLSHMLRRNPWMIALAYRFWRRVQTKYTIGVVGVIFDENQRVLLVEHVFHPKVPWGLPGGWINHKEDPQTAVKREIKEELQLTVEVDVALLAEFHHGNHLDLAYICRPISEIGQLSYELLEYRWVDTEELPRLHLFHWRAIQHALKISQQMTDG